jgi:hypothetical protein
VKIVIVFGIILISLCRSVWAAQVLSEFEDSKCEEFKLSKPLVVYKDPSLFVGALGEFYNDPQQGWKSLVAETPVLTTLEGTVYLMKLGVASEFRNFGVISKLYELVDSRFTAKKTTAKSKTGRKEIIKRPLVMPIKICGSAYSDSLGFVLWADFQEAQVFETESGAMPPSVFPNPIPLYKKR